MAAEGRRDRMMGRDRGPRGGADYGDPPGGYPPPPRDRGPPPRGDPGRDRSPVRDPYDDRFRDPYREPPRDPARPPPPPRDGRDPYYDDPYRRPPPPDPYYDRFRDDPYRRDPYADPYRDPYRDPYYEPPPARKPPPPECVFVLMKAPLRAYGESIERKVKALNVITDLVTIPEDKTLAQQIEDISRHGGLFAVVINSQNELHHSLTLNILHGSPQEHRNMPIEDAISLIGRSFEKYLQSLKEKTGGAAAPPTPAAAPAPPTPAAPAARSAPFLPPSKEVSYLLNLLADNRQLTLEELDKIILYLRDRRDKMVEARPLAAGDGAYRDSDRLPAEDGLMAQQQEQQQLQTKILSILNGSNPPSGGVSAPPSRLAAHQPAPVAPSSGGGGVNAAMINFDNPSVQKALDNLIQSGPNLLRNISATQSTGPDLARDPTRQTLLSTPVGGPRPSYAGHPGMGAPAPQMRGMGPARPRF